MYRAPHGTADEKRRVWRKEEQQRRVARILIELHLKAQKPRNACMNVENAAVRWLKWLLFWIYDFIRSEFLPYSLARLNLASLLLSSFSSDLVWSHFPYVQLRRANFHHEQILDLNVLHMCCRVPCQNTLFCWMGNWESPDFLHIHSCTPLIIN